MRFDQLVISIRNQVNNDINEIVFSLKQIDNIANRRGIVHFVLIPPVYESSISEYMDSFVNKVLNKKINISQYLKPIFACSSTQGGKT